MAVTGAQSGFVNIFSFGGLVFVTALYAFPYIFVFTADALELVSSEMEEAANILGSGALRTICKVTLPLVTPAIIGGCIVVFLDTVALFGTPAIIALPARIKIMTLQLWQFFEFPVRAEAAAAYAIPLVLITVALFAVQRLILGRRGYVALTGKGGSRRLMVLGGARGLMFGYALLVVALAVFLPFAALAQAAFSRAWGRGFSWDNLTLGNFGAAARRGECARRPSCTASPTRRRPPASAWRSRCSSPISSAGSWCPAASCSRRSAWRRWSFRASCSPSASTRPGRRRPSRSMAPRRSWCSASPRASCRSRSSTAWPGLRSLNPEMEEAVRILGGGRLLAVSRVVVPLLKKSLVGSWLLVFIPGDARALDRDLPGRGPIRA